MTPWDALAAYAETVVPAGVSVYPTPTPTPTPPCIVIQPDEPWRAPDRYCADAQHYLVAAVVSVGAPADGQALIYQIHSAVIAALPAAWDYDGITAITTRESGGSQLMASALRLTYRGDDAT